MGSARIWVSWWARRGPRGGFGWGMGTIGAGSRHPTLPKSTAPEHEVAFLFLCNCFLLLWLISGVFSDKAK